MLSHLLVKNMTHCKVVDTLYGERVLEMYLGESLDKRTLKEAFIEGMTFHRDEGDLIGTVEIETVEIETIDRVRAIRMAIDMGLLAFIEDVQFHIEATILHDEVYGDEPWERVLERSKRAYDELMAYSTRTKRATCLGR